MSAPRRLLSRLRTMMAAGAVPLHDVVQLVAAELVAEVSSVYAVRGGDLLELLATEGLRQQAVGRTRLRVGEGIVGLVAAQGKSLNLPDAQNHPRFVYRSETGEEPFASMLAVPVRRAGRTLGVLTVQNRMPRRYSEDEVEVVETVAMLLAEVLAASGAAATVEAASVDATLPRQFKAARLAPGIAIGPAVMPGTGRPARRLLADDPDAELARVGRAVEDMQQGLDLLMEGAAADGAAGSDHASREVMAAYRLLAADAGWLRRVEDAVRGGLAAEAAVQRVAGDLRARMRRVADPYLRERLADLEDVAERLLAALEGAASGPLQQSVAPGSILLARRLGPAQLLDWHGRGIAAVAIEEASPAGHAAILARALGLPVVGGTRGLLDAAEEGDCVVLDADEGRLILRPESEVQAGYRSALAARAQRQAGFAVLRHAPAASADGERLRLMLNVGLAMELDQLDATGADGIGLFRTEIAMLARGSIAEAAEQTALYARVLDAAAGRPVIFRTLDLGADKMLPDAAPAEEENPAMGWRSLRVGLDRPALLRRQLRALLLAAGGRALSVMFPMVATAAEFHQARALLEAEAARVHPAPEQLAIGAMVEVPSLLWQLEPLLREADFLSIGSNDLMQFLFAADRGTPALAARYDVLSPAMLNVLDALARQAAAAAVPLSLCGEAASRPLEALTLAALGITTLSMPAPAVLPVKAMFASVDLGNFRAVLAALRRGGDGEASLRDPIAAWARELGLGH
jgi:phosphotransferase system enzyme I (PtsP)